MHVPLGSSLFQGFAADVKDFDEVNKAYLLMRYQYPEARHIACAVQFHNANSILGSGQCDEEYGCGRMLLELLQDAGAYNRLIFVVRKTDGAHLGANRFDGYLQAAKHAMNAKPYNKYMGGYCFSWPARKGTKGRQMRYQRVDTNFGENSQEVTTGNENTDQDNI